MLDYWLNKLFFDVHTDRTIADEYSKTPESVLVRYPLSGHALAAVREDDVAYMSKHTNPFLMRYYFIVRGMPEQDFFARLKRLQPSPKV